MKRTVRLLAVILAALLLVSPLTFAVGYPDVRDSRHPDALARLITCGFFIGTDKGLELDRSLTRSEAAVLVVRVMGSVTSMMKTDMPFTDVASWAAPYVGYLYNTGAVRGVSATRYGANDPVTAQQFYTMLLRVLGYNDAKGDFAYADALSFAVSKGLLDAAEAERVKTVFLRDDAAFACYQALNAVPKGEKQPYAVLKSGEINNDYSARDAATVTGTNKVFQTLWEGSKAVSELDSLTIIHHGTYKESGSVLYDDTIDTDIRLFPKLGECWLLLDIRETKDGNTVGERHAEAWSDGRHAAIWNNEEWAVGQLLPENADRFAGIYDRLFGPDNVYSEIFDYAEEDGEIVLSGFLSRFALLGDPTSETPTNYYFDVTLHFDAQTHLLRSVQCVYRDTWNGSDGPSDVEYISEYTIRDINSTVMPADTHDLEKALLH